MAEYKVGRRYHHDKNDVIEITGRKKDGSYTYSRVNPKTGYLMKGFGGTVVDPSVMLAKLKKAHELANNPDAEKDLADDPNDNVTSVKEYDDATVETFGEEITPFDEDAEPIDESLAKAGNTVKALGKVAIVTGTLGMMTVGFMVGPVIAVGIAFAGLGSFLGLDFLGERMRKKAGIVQKKIYMV